MVVDTERKAKRILIVEDDENLNRFISNHLLKNGFNAEWVDERIAPKERLSKEIFDIFVSGIHGFQICQTIKENPAAFKTSGGALAARTQLIDKIYGNLGGADYELSNPFSVSKLMEVIKELIASRDKDYLNQIPLFSRFIFTG